MTEEAGPLSFLPPCLYLYLSFAILFALHVAVLNTPKT